VEASRQAVIEGGRGGPAFSTDEELVLSVAAGDVAALAELHDRYARPAFGLAARVLRDRDLAQDAVQEAFLGVWRSAASFRPGRGTARSWLLTLVHRRAVDLVRREERRAPVELWGWDGRTESESAEQAAWLQLERRRVRVALERLSPTQRRLLELAYYAGLTQSQIAARLDLPLGTVKRRTWEALARLRELLGDEQLDSAELACSELATCSVGTG
jgi:RNA polymerase sigma-70 factor (ECF subfamily)